MTSVTLKTFHDMPIASVGALAGGEPDSEAFWDLVTLIFSSTRKLQAGNVMGYSYISANLFYNGTVAESQKTTEFLTDAIAGIPAIMATYEPTQFDSLYDWYQANKIVAPVGQNSAVGNRLLDAKSLSNLTALRAAMQKATPSGTIANLNLVAGPGLRSAVPASGSDSVHPALREAYVEYGMLIFRHRRSDEEECR